jgi:hypothetical protein
MSDGLGFGGRAGPGPPALSPEPRNAVSHESGGAFPQEASVLLERLGSLYGLRSELEAFGRATEPLAAVPIETSVSLRSSPRTDLRLTLGIAPRPGDPESRLALVAALSRLGSVSVAGAVDEALASVAPMPGRRRSMRALALRVCGGAPVQVRAASWVGGTTVAERVTRVSDALLRLGLERLAALHRRLTAQLAANPFNAVVPYGFGVEVSPDRVLAAKTYFQCEWVDVTAGLLTGPLADDLGLDRTEGVELLAESARADRRRERWLMELSLELPAEPARGARVKAYLPPASLAVTEAEGHTAVISLALRLGLDPGPYQALVAAARPGGLSPARPCSLSVGVSAGTRGPSLEVYLLNPGR